MENIALYQLYEIHRATIAPINQIAKWSKDWFAHNQGNMFMNASASRYGGASFELLERITRQYGKPRFGINEVVIDGKAEKVHTHIIMNKPFCHLRQFTTPDLQRDVPKVLVVAPMSGHHATLLRGTVEALIPHADVYITDWVDAKEVSVMQGNFDLDDYIDYVRDCIRHIGEDVHVIAVCQPAVPVLAATALMAEDKDPFTPKSLTLMGGPIDTRIGVTKVNELAEQKPLEWFRCNVITRVPFNHAGFMRRVYPGFLQLSGFMTMNLDRHIGEHVKLFDYLVQGDGENAASHRAFYDEYLSVCDLPAEFYLATIDKVFQRHLLPKGQLDYRGRLVKPAAIKNTALLCVEGERDDISGVGQTKAALDLCKNIPAEKRRYHLQKATGHYGIFNGRKYREQVLPVILEHIKTS
jgi:poly(3-hydroxybutyrate) depolymerase